MKRALLLLLALLILNGCGGVDPSEFERDNPVINEREEIPTEKYDYVPPGDDVAPEPASESGILGNQMLIEIEKKISVNTAHIAKGWKDGPSGPVTQQQVDLQFITVGGYTALLVIHHLVGEYTASAEFRITQPWTESLTLHGNEYKTRVEWQGGGSKVLVLKYDNQEILNQVVLGNRTFFLRDFVTEVAREMPVELEAGYHQVIPGESLLRIANKYGTTVEALKSLNDLSSSTIHPGKKLRYE